MVELLEEHLMKINVGVSHRHHFHLDPIFLYNAEQTSPCCTVEGFNAPLGDFVFTFNMVVWSD